MRAALLPFKGDPWIVRSPEQKKKKTLRNFSSDVYSSVVLITSETNCFDSMQYPVWFQNSESKWHISVMRWPIVDRQNLACCRIRLVCTRCLVIVSFRRPIIRLMMGHRGQLISTATETRYLNSLAQSTSTYTSLRLGQSWQKDSHRLVLVESFMSFFNRNLLQNMDKTSIFNRNFYDS